ncbi:MAG: PIN domain-containing protein [Candidatus Dormibacteraeota bacterium]|nr:PIN domain-containing protein [Candidatus Dormibacteraeota bacterium]
MSYLLDTDTISAAVRRIPDIGVVRRLARAPQSEVFTSAITVGELVYGLARRQVPDLDRRIETLLATLPVISFDEAAAYRYGVTRASLERIGQRLDDPDLRIASIALAHDLVLVSGNEKHFRRVPDLRLENWVS